MQILVQKSTGILLPATGGLIYYGGETRPADQVSVRCGVPVSVQMLDDDLQTPLGLAPGEVLYLDVKPSGEYDENFTCPSPVFTAPANLATGYYTGTLNTDTPEAIALVEPNDPSGVVSNDIEPAIVPLMAQLRWGVPGQPANRSQTWTISLQNSVGNGNEGVPTSANPSYPPALMLVAFLNAFLATTGGYFNLTSAAGNVFAVALTGNDADPAPSILPAGAAAAGIAFPPGYSGQAILRNQSTPNAFALVYEGNDDANPELSVLPRAAAIPPVTCLIDLSGNVSLLNLSTRNFLPFALSGPDDNLSL